MRRTRTNTHQHTHTHTRMRMNNAGLVAVAPKPRDPNLKTHKTLLWLAQAKAKAEAEAKAKANAEAKVGIRLPIIVWIVTGSGLIGLQFEFWLFKNLLRRWCSDVSLVNTHPVMPLSSNLHLVYPPTHPPVRVAGCCRKGSNGQRGLASG